MSSVFRLLYGLLTVVNDEMCTRVNLYCYWMRLEHLQLVMVRSTVVLNYILYSLNRTNWSKHNIIISTVIVEHFDTIQISIVWDMDWYISIIEIYAYQIRMMYIFEQNHKYGTHTHLYIRTRQKHNFRFPWLKSNIE